MKLSNADIDILKILIEQRLSELENKSDILQSTVDDCNPEILQQIDKKLSTLYFS